MPDLLISGIDDALYARLERRAQTHGRSVQEEVRETLRIAIAGRVGKLTGENLADIAKRYFGPGNGFELDLPSRKDDLQRPPPDFSGSDYDR